MTDRGTDSPFKIPESAYEPLRHVIEMANSDFIAFVEGLKTATPSLSSSGLSKHITRIVPTVSPAIISSIVEELNTLEYLKQDTEMSPSEFAAAIALAALEETSESFPIDSDGAALIETRLTAIFESDHVLELNTKVVSVLTDHDKLFLSAKILTDARPIFDKEGTALKAMAIVHMLRVHFEKNSKHADFYAAMDVADLRKLKEAIERAEQKEALLVASFAASGISYIDVDPSDAHH